MKGVQQLDETWGKADPRTLNVTRAEQVLILWNIDRTLRVLGPLGEVKNRTGEITMDYPGYAMINTIIAANRPWDGPTWQLPRLTVMPLGDSITLGVGSSTRTGYRPALAQRLVQRSGGVVEFVGSLVDADGVTRHEGHSGWRIDELQANIETWLAAAKPNLITLHIGTNDMNRDYQVATAPQRLAALIDQIHAASPDTVVVVATLVPATDPAVQARIDTYNQAIPGIVLDRFQRGYKIQQVGMGSLTTDDLNDNLHPNNNGYAKMTNAFMRGIGEVAGKGWIKETVEVKPAPPRQGADSGDYDVDVNGDGRADYLVVEDNGAVRAWLNTADPTTGAVEWTDQGFIASGSNDWSAYQVRFADVGGDARADYLVVDPANGAVRAIVNMGGDGRGGWQDRGYIATGSSGWTGAQVRFADVGGDARADYLVVGPNGATRALLNTAPVRGPVARSASQTSAATPGPTTSSSVTRVPPARTSTPVETAAVAGRTRASSPPAPPSGSPARSASPTSTPTAAPTTSSCTTTAPSTPTSTPPARPGPSSGPTRE